MGQRGERLAARLLGELGLDVLVRNYRDFPREIDIVARDGEVLCFVEVKTRRSAIFSRPSESVGQAKKRLIIRAAHRYLREIGRPPVVYRFDIVEVVLDRWRVKDVRYYPNAFSEQEVRRKRGPI